MKYEFVPKSYKAPQPEPTGEVNVDSETGFITKEDRKGFLVGGGDKCIKIDNNNGFWAGNAVATKAPTLIDLNGNLSRYYEAATTFTYASDSSAVSLAAGQPYTTLKTIVIDFHGSVRLSWAVASNTAGTAVNTKVLVNGAQFGAIVAVMDDSLYFIVRTITGVKYGDVFQIQLETPNGVGGRVDEVTLQVDRFYGTIIY